MFDRVRRGERPPLGMAGREELRLFIGRILKGGGGGRRGGEGSLVI